MNDERVLKAKHSLTFLLAVTVRIPSLLTAEITLSGGISHFRVNPPGNGFDMQLVLLKMYSKRACEY